MRDSPVKQYYKKRLTRLLLPYFIWSTIYTLINIINYVRNHIEINIKDIILCYLTGGAVAPLYYIIVLVQLTLLTPLIFNMIKNKYFKNLIWLISPIYLILMYYYNIKYNAYPKYYNVIFCGWLSFYLLGITLRNHYFSLKKYITVIGSKLNICLCIVLCIIEAVIITSYKLNSAFAMNQMKISSFLLSFAICIKSVNDITVRNKLGLGRHKILKLLGDNSYGMFYSHELFKIPTLVILNKCAINTWIIRFVICWIVMTFFSFYLSRMYYSIKNSKA